MAAAPGAVEAVVCCGTERLLQVSLPSTGTTSDNISKLKQQTMAFMTDFLKQKNMSLEEVDLLEEVISDDEGEGRKSGKGKGNKGKKRKQQEAPKT